MGLFNRLIADHLVEDYNFITISYHCEASKRFKEKVKDNIVYLKEKNFQVNVNVMFHSKPEYFEESMKVCEFLKDNNVEFTPRMIGMGRAGKGGKVNNRYSHLYTSEQLSWMADYWADVKKKNRKTEVKPKDNLKLAKELGRPCCGGRVMNVCNGKQWNETKFLKFTKFKGWKCSVNWFFLHIEQQTGLVYHHQTCQARFDGTRGPIGTIKSADKILQNLRAYLKNGIMPVINCPNDICGCGLCVPKSLDKRDFEKILPRHIDNSVFEKTSC